MMLNLDMNTGMAWSATLIVLYLCAVRLLRYRTRNKLESRYAQFVQNPYSMDYKTAHEIIQVTILREFPFIFSIGSQWALLKSFSFEDGSKPLAQSRRLTSPNSVGKRTEDTGVMVAELIFSGIDSERGLRALSKINWIHRQYGSKVSNEGKIYTMGLFIREPINWIGRYDWRPMSELEQVALFVYWREIAHRMGSTDIPQTLDKLAIWMAEVEDAKMGYADTNEQCAESVVRLFLRPAPRFLHGVARKFIAAPMEPKVRAALGMSDPPRIVVAACGLFFYARALIVRNLFLPRFRPLDLKMRQGRDGRVVRNQWVFEPWYVPESWLSRTLKKLPIPWSPLPGPAFKSNGYLPEELGPVEYEQRSKDAVLAEAKQMKGYADAGGAEVMGCPFMFRQ